MTYTIFDVFIKIQARCLYIVVLTEKGKKKMSTGTIKWFNSRKGYGFIQPSDGGKDVFVHITKLEEIGVRHLNDGQKIQYELYNDRGRIAAGNLVLL